MKRRFSNQRLAQALILVVAALLLVPQAWAQNPTGDLIGKVTDPNGAGLPGATVSATSPNLQGERVTQTGGNGSYKLGLLPPGDYRVTYELEGFASVTRQMKISAAQTQTSNIGMQISVVAEEIIVSALSGSIAETGSLSTTFTSADVEGLPIGRDINATMNLAPGVHDTGPSAAPSINGAMSFENLFMVNGVQIQDNIRGSALPLFIESAIQETTITTAAVSAEYGRFTGGVVNVLTKSGGNELSGSLRVNYTNEDWIAETPVSDPRIDDISHTEEGTLGGFFWKDHIWFFGAARQVKESATGQTAVTQVSYPTSDNEDRTEGKLTFSVTPSHSLIGSYLEIERTRSGATFGNVLDLASLNNRTDPQQLKSGNYTGILTSSFFLEAQYSERELEIATGFGGPSPDGPNDREGIINGTMMRDRPSARRYFSSQFCGDCEAEIRNNEDALIKGSYFLNTENGGTHDLVFGYDNFSDIRFSVNHQTGSDFEVWGERTYIVDENNIFPVFTGGQTWIVWWPPIGLDIAQPTDFETNSLYVNDSWQLNDKWSFNLGVRYDENNGRDSSNALVADDSKISPRLGVNYDVKGDGDLVLRASVGTYVAQIANTGNVADGASTGGALAGFLSTYGGPAVNADPGCVDTGTCTSTHDALAILYDWYFSNGGTADVTGDLSNIPGLFYSCIPGATTQVRQSFRSPAADEITLGVTKRLGNKGLLRGDLIYRKWNDFYSNRTIPGDIVQTPAGPLDVVEIGNFDSALERDYIGLNLQSRYRFSDRLTVAGNYTWSKLEGNINGETGGSGPVSSSPGQNPEYFENSWSFPSGKLNADQRHKVRVWAIYDLIDTEHNNLSISLLQNYWSGNPVNGGDAITVDTRPYVTNPGYEQPPASVTYFFRPRGSTRTDNITRTDLAVNYSFRWSLWGKDMEVFIQPEIINVFNADSLISFATNTLDAENSGLATFNPFTETPVQGVHYDLDDDFGQAENEDDFQTPRTYRFGIGFRF